MLRIDGHSLIERIKPIARTFSGRLPAIFVECTSVSCFSKLLQVVVVLVNCGAMAQASLIQGL